MSIEIITGNGNKIFSERTRIFTILISCICSILIMATPYRMDVYYWTCSKHFYFFPTSIFPLMFISQVIIIISSFLMFKKKKTIFEIIIIVSSLLGLPGVVLGDFGQVIFLLCGPARTIFLPTTYFALLYFLFMSIWSSILLVKKKELIKKMETSIS